MYRWYRITDDYQHDYLEIAYIVCTGAPPASIDKATILPDTDSRDRVLAKLKNARQQFRQASILVVLDFEALELITFYKKADIVKDQQAILSKFGHICKINMCKIERKNACRVIDLVKPEMARTWRLFSEAVLSSLTLQTPAGGKVLNIDTNIYLVPEFEAAFNDGSPRSHWETKYYLRKADLQIVLPGHLLLAFRDSSWPPLHALTDMIDADVLSWKLQVGSVLYLVPTGQLAIYRGGWIGKQNSTNIQPPQHSGYTAASDKHRSWWFEKVRQWLEIRNRRFTPLSQDTVWCSIEIPVHESVEGNAADRGPIVWKTAIWPADLLFAFHDASEPGLQDGCEDFLPDPLSAAQAWFSKDLGDVRAAATEKDSLQPKHEACLADGNLFDDDVHFGSPQQFMTLPAQSYHPSQMVYPTPPEAMNPQNTPGISMDGAAQTPMSTQPMQQSIYQSSPLAMATDPEANRSHESAISSFLQHNDDDLFEDEEDQKLVQPSFGDEPNWDFFDRDTTTPDMKPEASFEETNISPVPEKHPDAEQDVRSKLARPQTAKQEDSAHNTPNKDVALTVSPKEKQETPLQKSTSIDASKARTSDTAETVPSNIKDFAHDKTRESRTASIPPGTKRRRSSAYDVTTQAHVGHDHKYGLTGKYHFELRRASAATKDDPGRSQLNRRSSSSSSSSRSSMSQDTSEEESPDGQAKSWTRYEPVHTRDTQETHVDDAHDDPLRQAEIDELLGIISTASGTEPFTSTFPSKQNNGKDAGGRKTPDRWLMIAQILTEQLTQSSVFRSYEELQLPRTRVSPAFDVFVESAEIGTNISNASLGDLVNIQPSQPNNNNSKLGTRTLVLEPDRIRLRQGDSEITAELPVTRYWETLNLQPLSGPKYVQALCLHPEGSNYVQGCESFMRRLEETYTSCSLGTHQRLRSKALTDSGLLAWNSIPGKDALTPLCRSVGKTLASTKTNGCTIVYMILPNDDLSGIIEICDAFVELFETMGQADYVPENDIVLQLIPSSFVIDPSKLVVRPQKQYTDLAIEVYNRTPSPKSSSASVTAGATILEKPVGRSLRFELNSKTSTPFLGAGNCYHLAYCTSTDYKWLVASWSDAIGKTALTMPYCLFDEENGTRRPRKEVLRHVCETSAHLMGSQKGQSWLAIAKVGIYEPEELQEWVQLSQQLIDENKFVSRIVMLNVELQSRLTLHGPQTPFKQIAAITQPAMNALSTPVTTPQAYITSPDQTVSATVATSMPASAQTPPDLSTDMGAEVDAYLSDPLNEAWAMTFAFGLNQTHNSLEIRPAMASGLLLKRVARQDTGGLAVLNVNLIAVPRRGPPGVPFAEREQILQDVLVQYRGLHVLGVARRCTDEAEGCVPWHVATAFKGAKILERLM